VVLVLILLTVDARELFVAAFDRFF